MIQRLRRLGTTLALVLAIGLAAAPASAQVEESLSAYTGANAEGYMMPLRDALASGLSDGLFTSGHIPQAKPYVRVGLRAMIINYGSDDETFSAVPESYFDGPSDPVTASTLVGPGESVVVDGNNGSQFVFPGGLEISRTALAVPQITVGGLKGTEATLRVISLELGDDELGDFSLFGIGARHSISQYFDALPVDLAGGLFFQSLSLGEDFLDFSMVSFGVQASTRFPIVAPYAGLGLDSSSMEVVYDDIDGNEVTLEFDRANNFHLTLGAAVRLTLVHLSAEINVSDQTSFALGLSVGN